MRAPVKQKRIERERMFAQAYLAARFNGKTAAIMCGVAPGAAATEGARFLRSPTVQAALNDLVNEQIARHGLTVDRMMLEAKKLGLSSMANYTRKTDDGSLVIDFTDTTEDQMAAVESITVEEYTEGRGEGARTVKRTKLKLHSKLEAMNLIIRVLTATMGKGGGPLLPEPGPGSTVVNNFNLTQTNVSMTAADATAEYRKMLDMTPGEYRDATEVQDQRSLPPPE